MKTFAQERRERRSEPVDRPPPPKESGFPQNASDSFTSRLYIAIDGRRGIKARRGALARAGQFPSSPLDVEFVHRCLIQLERRRRLGVKLKGAVEACAGVIGLFLSAGGKGGAAVVHAEVLCTSCRLPGPIRG